MEFELNELKTNHLYIKPFLELQEGYLLMPRRPGGEISVILPPLCRIRSEQKIHIAMAKSARVKVYTSTGEHILSFRDFDKIIELSKDKENPDLWEAYVHEVQDYVEEAVCDSDDRGVQGK